MFFLLRTAFWLSLVILLIPADDDGNQEVSEPEISTFQAIGAAQQTYVDMTRFCERNPVACETGASAVEIFAAKARSGARMVYEYLDPQGANDTDAGETAVGAAPASAADSRPATSDVASREPRSDRNLHTGSTGTGPRGVRDTLTPSDRQPSWVPPAPVRKPV